MKLKDEEKELKTEDFDEEFKIHTYKREYEAKRGRDEVIHITVFEKKKDFDPSKAFGYQHGATAPADEDAFRVEAKELRKDRGLSKEKRNKLADELEDRGERYDKFDISFRESREHENAVESLHRMVYHLGDKCPQFTFSITWGEFWLYAPDSEGKLYESCTVDNYHKLLDEAVELVGAKPSEFWSLGHSMGGLNQMILAWHQAKFNTSRYSKMFIADGILFPGDFNESRIGELLLSQLNFARVVIRMLAEFTLYEHEWKIVNPMGHSAHTEMLLNKWPDTLLHVNGESIFPTKAKNFELWTVAKEMGSTKIKLLKTPTTHSYMPALAMKDFFTNDKFRVSDHILDCNAHH